MNGDSEALVAQGYDAVYQAIPHAPTLWQIWRDHAVGPDYPADFGHISFATLGDLRWLGDALRLTDDDMLVDLACGMGGPSLWIASKLGARLVGVDSSFVAVELAQARADRLGLGERGKFVVGTLAHTGLANRHADAVLSLDALQYAPSKDAAFQEAARILKPGRRLAFTAFEVLRERAADLPVLGDDPVDDYQPLLDRAGFAVDRYEETAGWSERLSRTYESILHSGAALEREMGAAAYGSLSLEVSMTLERKPYRRRVTVTATRR